MPQASRHCPSRGLWNLLLSKDILKAPGHFLKFQGQSFHHLIQLYLSFSRTIGKNQNPSRVSADVPATLLCFTAMYYTSNIVFSSIRGQCITHSAHCRLEVESLLYPVIQNHWNVFNSSVFHRLIFKEKKYTLDYKSMLCLWEEDIL